MFLLIHKSSLYPFYFKKNSRQSSKICTRKLKSQTKKKQDRLLVNVACDHGDDGVPAGQYLGSMWNYLRKYKNNHAKNSLPPAIRSNASTDARIWESGPATLNPLKWHCYRFALGHHLFKHKLSPYDEKEAKLISSRHTSVQAQASSDYTATPNLAPIPSSCYPSPYLNSPPRSRNCFQTSLLALLESPIGCYKLETLNFSRYSYYSSMAYGNPTCNLPIGKSPSCNPFTKAMTKDKTDPASYRGKYLKDTLAKLFEGLLLARLNFTTHTELDNTLTSHQLGTKPCTQTHDAICSLISTIQYNKYALQKPTYVAFVDYSTAYPSMHRDKLSSILLGYCTIALQVICCTTFVLALTIFDFESCTPTFKNVKQLTSSTGSLKVADSVPPYSAYLLLTLSMNSKLNLPTLLLILHLVYNTMGQLWIGGLL